MSEPPDRDDSERPSRSFVPDFVKKVAVSGLGAVLMTEDGLRTLANQLKVPKELLGFFVNQAERTKDEINRVLSEELRRFLQSDKLREEFVKLLATMSLEVKAEIRLRPKSGTDDGTGSGASVEVHEFRAKSAPRKKK